MTATFYVGDVLDVLGKLPEKSVDLVLSSPPFLSLRSYLPSDHPDKHLEGGSQSTPGEYIDWLLDVVEACDRVLAPHGSLCFELGDTYAGSGGAGGDYNADGLRAGQPAFGGSGRRGNPSVSPDGQTGHYTGRQLRPFGPNAGRGWPLPKSLSLIPESFRFAMVYGFNPFTGRQTERWRLRNVIRWVRPNPPVGALGDKFRPATSELMVFCKSAKRYFDLDAVRTGVKFPDKTRTMVKKVGVTTDHKEAHYLGDLEYVSKQDANNPAGAPPLDWWNIPLLEGEEPTRYGEKEERPYQREQNAKRVTPPGQRPRQVDDSTNPNGAPPLDWWNIPPGGYEGAHYAVWPPELLIKPIKAMCPEQVCRTCGEARRRIVSERIPVDQSNRFARQPALAAHIRERRVAAGFTFDDLNGWFGFKAIASHWEVPGYEQGRVPNSETWPVLKERLGLSDEFDDLIYGERKWADVAVESTVAYLTKDGEALAPSERRVAYDRGGLPPTDASRVKANRKAPDEWTDCSHDDYRPGLVLDPFVGSGTTLSVATGHGRDAIGIDLDSRNWDLALERVGPLVLQRGEVAA